MFGLKRVVGKCFARRDVVLDGYQFIECSFTNCQLVFFGKNCFNLEGNIISPDCVVEFRGGAAETIRALGELYVLGDWGKRGVVSALRGIYGLPANVSIETH